MNAIFFLSIALVALCAATSLLAYICYARLRKLQRRYQYVVRQLQLASSIYYGYNTAQQMPRPEEQL